MYDHEETYASFWEGYQAFEVADPHNPYSEDDENRRLWADGWPKAFDDWERA